MAVGLFLTSFGTLALARQATPLSTQLLIVPLVLAVIVLITEWDSFWVLMASAVVFAGCFYVPGALWLAVISGLICFRNLVISFYRLNWRAKLGLLVWQLVLIAPLGYHLVRYYSKGQVLHWLGWGLPNNLSAFKHFGLNLVQVPLDLSIHSSKLPLSLGNLPLFPVALSLLALLGLYCYLTRLANYRWRSIGLLLIGSWLLIGFGVLTIYSLIPLVIIAAATGMAFILKKWYTIFPKNPFARYSGLILMTSVVLLIAFFQARSYFVAWANDPSTIAAYRITL
ncbi:MAG: hypothetical protein ACREGF_07780 [Candidatus Saccharimonadales bacterium]